MSTSLCVTTKCDECQDCFWDPENNCTYTCDITKPCICGRPKAVILEPITGDGSFDVRSGLYFDEHLERPITADDTIKETDRTFIGIELVDIQKPTMVVVVEKLWVTATKDPDDPDATVLIRKLPSGCAIVHPLMEGGKYPQPNAYDAANPDEHPHTAFEIDFMGISEGFVDVPNFSGFFIHVVTKVFILLLKRDY